MPDEIQEVNVELPQIIDDSEVAIAAVTTALGIPREMLASQEEIAHAWSQLPRLLGLIPPHVRSPHHAKMCVAVSVGLFDAALNYVWNSAILELRNKVRRFGVNVVSQLLQRDFTEKNLDEIRDSELLDLCLKLNLISEDAYFFLSHCREVRNNFSTAHPPMGQIDEDEFVVFVKRCARYALAETSELAGVDTQSLLDSIAETRFSGDQVREWAARIEGTHDFQRELIFSTLHGLYCDPQSNEDARRNAIDLCIACKSLIVGPVRSKILARHSDYVASGEAKRQKASQKFFEAIGQLSSLSSAEQHRIISLACNQLLAVHNAYNNFYNEPPFAQRLLEVSQSVAIPESAQQDFVIAVLTCAVGNEYGVSDGAFPSYCAMIRSFSPQELAIMFKLPQSRVTVGWRIRNSDRCKRQFAKIVKECVDSMSITTTSKSEYGKWIGR